MSDPGAAHDQNDANIISTVRDMFSILMMLLCQLKAAKAPTRGISCLLLVLYGVRIGCFHAREGPITGGFHAQIYLLGAPTIDSFRAW